MTRTKLTESNMDFCQKRNIAGDYYHNLTGVYHCLYHSLKMKRLVYIIV